MVQKREKTKTEEALEEEASSPVEEASSSKGVHGNNPASSAAQKGVHGNNPASSAAQTQGDIYILDVSPPSRCVDDEGDDPDKGGTGPAAPSETAEAPTGSDEEKRSREEGPAEKEASSKEEAESVQTNPEYLELRNRFLRLAADFDNYRKRSERERKAILESGNSDLIKSLLPVLDNLKRALNYATQPQALEEGVRMIANQFDNVMKYNKVVAINTSDAIFDPLQHEALQYIPSDTLPRGMIIEELETGYLLHDRLLRPSRVVVSAGPIKIDKGALKADNQQKGKENNRATAAQKIEAVNNRDNKESELPEADKAHAPVEAASSASEDEAAANPPRDEEGTPDDGNDKLPERSSAESEAEITIEFRNVTEGNQGE